MDSNAAVQEMLVKALEGATGIQMDMTTVYLALIGLTVIVVGFQVIVNSLEAFNVGRSNRHDDEEAKEVSWLLDDKSKTKYERDVLNARYKRIVRSRSSRRF